MEPEGSLPHSQVPATCPYPKPARSSPYPTSYFLKIRLNITLPSTPGSPKWFFPSCFPTKTSYTPLLFPKHTTCPAHLIIFDFITRKVLGEQYRSLSSSLCSFLTIRFYSQIISHGIHCVTNFNPNDKSRGIRFK